MVPGDPSNENLGIPTKEPSLPLPTVVSKTEENKKKKKPRYSKAKKRELQQRRLFEEEEERKQKKFKKRKRARTKPNATSKTPKSDPPIDEIDRILQCAEKSLFTDSIVVVNKNDSFIEPARTMEVNTENKDLGDGFSGEPKQRRLVVEILSGCDLLENTDNGEEAIPEPLPLPASSLTQKLFWRTICTIKVQPLIVLDLNGILCHRDRKPKRSSFLESLHADPRFHKNAPVIGNIQRKHWELRRPIGNVANTAIIPRTDLLDFLHFLDKHFCLAIWTSAKPKTAKKLLNMLLSGDKAENSGHDDGSIVKDYSRKNDCRGIRRRLLFVWSQTQCTAIRSMGGRTSGTTEEIAGVLSPMNESTSDSLDKKENDDDEFSFDDTVVFEKHLPKIWEAYPLWSASNTLLIDDSPEKCPLAISNAIHPPPLHGRNLKTKRGQDNRDGEWFLSDQENEERQSVFFRKLVAFWTDHHHLAQPSWTSTEEKSPRCKDQKDTGKNEERKASVGTANATYSRFLQTHAKGYMGWREENKT